MDIITVKLNENDQKRLHFICDKVNLKKDILFDYIMALGLFWEEEDKYIHISGCTMSFTLEKL